MNIKNLLGNTVLGTPAATKVGSVNRPIKSENANQDRDANGQTGYSRQKKKEKMSPEQFAKAIEILKDKSFVKDMNWIVSAVTENDVKYALVQDQEGKTIRKIAEYDLWEVFDSSGDIPNKGQLLKKVA